MALEPFVTPQMLRDTLSPATYMALFDDEQTGSISDVDESAPVLLLLRRAHIRVVSWLGHNYTKLPLVTDTDVSDLLIDAELNYAVGMAYDRHPEYTRSYGEEPKRKAAWDQAELTMMRVQEAILRLPDAPSMGQPANVGGIVYESGPRTLTDSIDGTFNGGDL